MAEGATYETVWGRLAGDAAAEVEGLWIASGAMTAEAAQAQLASAACLLRGPDGGLRGVSWVRAEDIPLVAGRRFWVYRSVLAGSLGEESDGLLAYTFAALDHAFDRDAGGPIGLCLLVTDAAEMERRAEAQWAEPPMLFAGYAPDGSQVRIGYFAGAQI